MASRNSTASRKGGGQQRGLDGRTVAVAGDHESQQQPAVNHDLLDVLHDCAASLQDVHEGGRHPWVVSPGDGDEQAHEASPLAL